MKKYKFITIRNDNGELFEKKLVYRIYTNRGNAHIGIISYYKPWKEYVFSSQPECVFNNTCLRDVLDFMENEIPKVGRDVLKKYAQTPTQSLLAFIVAKELPDTSTYMQLVPEIREHYEVRKSGGSQADYTEQLMQDIINWETGSQYASLETVLNEDYVITVKNKQ